MTTTPQGLTSPGDCNHGTTSAQDRGEQAHPALTCQITGYIFKAVIQKTYWLGASVCLGGRCSISGACLLSCSTPAYKLTGNDWPVDRVVIEKHDGISSSVRTRGAGSEGFSHCECLVTSMSLHLRPRIMTTLCLEATWRATHPSMVSVGGRDPNWMPSV